MDIHRIASRIAKRTDVLRTIDAEFNNAGVYPPRMKETSPGTYEGEIDAGWHLEVREESDGGLKIRVNEIDFPDMAGVIDAYKTKNLPSSTWKHWENTKVRLGDPNAYIWFPYFEFEGTYINPEGHKLDTAFTVGTEFPGRDMEFEPHDNVDISIDDILKNDMDAIEEMWDILYNSDIHKQVYKAYYNPNPKQEQMIIQMDDGDAKYSIPEILKA